MSVKSKIHITARKADFKRELNARIETLKARGMDAAAITKDRFVKKVRADLRKAGRQLTQIAALEGRNVPRAPQPEAAPEKAKKEVAAVKPEGKKPKKPKKTQDQPTED